MDLPVMPPVKPMLAKSRDAIPEGLHYEPKFDGFRCIVFRDGDEVELGSRNERPLTRYFPEVVEAVKAQLPQRCVVDGEIVVPRGPGLDFEALLQRIHPAASRVRLLAEETPASLIAFDLLALDDVSYMDEPFTRRRAALEEAMASSQPPVFLTRSTTSLHQAREWFDSFEGAGLDGIIGKAGDIPYAENSRLMVKVKHARTADCVVAGFRWHKSGPVVGSLMLGLYDEHGALQHVGVAASFSAARRRELLDELAPYRDPDDTSHPWRAWEHEERTPTATAGSRWNAGKDLSFESLRPDLVVEVSYDHMEGARFRHVAHFVRWRPDRDPHSCTFDQLEHPVDFDLAHVLAET